MSVVTLDGIVNGAFLPVLSPVFSVSASFARPNDSGSYTAGDVVSNSIATGLPLNFTGLGLTGQTVVNSATLRIDSTGNSAQFPSGTNGWNLHLYSTGPSGIADNLPFSIPAFDKAKYLGYIALSAASNFGPTSWTQNRSVVFATSDIPTAGILQTQSIYIPGAGDVLTLSLSSYRVG